MKSFIAFWEFINKFFPKFAHLLNLLDFLETISYFSKKDLISREELDDLLGNSLLFYFKIFRKWIYYRREKYNNNSYYSELENLIEYLQASEYKRKIEKIAE